MVKTVIRKLAARGSNNSGSGGTAQATSRPRACSKYTHTVNSSVRPRQQKRTTHYKYFSFIFVHRSEKNRVSAVRWEGSVNCIHFYATKSSSETSHCSRSLVRVLVS